MMGGHSGGTRFRGACRLRVAVWQRCRAPRLPTEEKHRTRAQLPRAVRRFSQVGGRERGSVRGGEVCDLVRWRRPAPRPLTLRLCAAYAAPTPAPAHSAPSLSASSTSAACLRPLSPPPSTMNQSRPLAPGD